MAVLLVGCGIALATGSASADDSGSDGVANAAADRDSGKQGKDERGDGKDDDDKDDDDKDDDDKDDDKKDDDKKDDDKKDDDKKDDDKKDDDDKKFPGRDEADEADDDDFIDIQRVGVGEDPTKERRDGSSGSFVARCGTNANRHLNSDNYMVAPDKRNGAQHVHDYVGNLSTDAFSDEESLGAAGTTCDKNNKSTFFWPVLRDTNGRDSDANDDGGGKDGNVGRILRPASAELRFLGSEDGKVSAMPDHLMIITGDAKAKANGDKNANAKWTCTGFTDRITEKYPLCPAGSRIMRILDYPSCWDGENIDSEDLRSHVVFPDRDGSCDDDFKAIPQLRITLTYDRPNGRDFAVDSFPDQQHDPRTDHSDFENMAPASVMNEAVNCINAGRNC